MFSFATMYISGLNPYKTVDCLRLIRMLVWRRFIQALFCLPHCLGGRVVVPIYIWIKPFFGGGGNGPLPNIHDPRVCKTKLYAHNFKGKIVLQRFDFFSCTLMNILQLCLIYVTNIHTFELKMLLKLRCIIISTFIWEKI